MTNDCVWTVGHHPSLCGTEKFSHQLAERLGIPVKPWGHLDPFTAPLVSCRVTEVDPVRWDWMPVTYDLFLHDWPDWRRPALPNWRRLTIPVYQSLMQARRVIAANRTIADQLRPYRPDVISAWAPSTLQGNPTRGAINVLTFGMAHKIRPAYYTKLKALLDAAGRMYTVSVSTAIHEGSPWDETAKVADTLRAIFGDHLRVLGYLADDALVREIDEATAIAIFYDPAFRENNTSGWAVLDRARPLITNIDDQSPPFTVYDIDRMDHWPEFAALPPQGGAGWDDLIRDVFAEAPCVNSR